MINNANKAATLKTQCRVVAVVPYYGIDAVSNIWLDECLVSLLTQTRPLDGIIVVDDASPQAPDATLVNHPTVTLLRNSSNTGPYAILDAIFSQMSADAVMLQDADDWSAPERCELLLMAGECSGAHMVGSQLYTIFEEDVASAKVGSPNPVPRNPRAALLEKPECHAMNMATTIVSVDFVNRLGGISSEMKFGGDSEFVRRAAFGGIVINIEDSLYYRRVHSRSLTQHPSTGYGSPARIAVQSLLQECGREMVRAYRRGDAVNLAPFSRGLPVRLSHITGPIII